MAVKRGFRRRALAGELDAETTFFGAYKPRERPSIATRAVAHHLYPRCGTPIQVPPAADGLQV